MLLLVLEKYGAPPKFVLAVKKMYENNIVVHKIEKEQVEMRQKYEYAKVTTWPPFSSYS